MEAKWQAPRRPVEHAEDSLVRAILDGTFKAGDTLPGERELAARLGVTRPTLREALQRLERDGWVRIHQGKPTVINDIWREGGLNILSALVRHSEFMPPNFVEHLLDVRLQLAPPYIALAVRHAAADVVALAREGLALDDTANDFAAYDWRLHHQLTILSGNPIYTLILNGFVGFYEQLARVYFSQAAARAASAAFYAALLEVAEQGDAEAAETLARRVMRASIDFWRDVTE